MANTRPQPLPIQRDGSTSTHTRNKENIPSPSPLKSTLNTRPRSFIPSLVQSSDKSDFFTDSYLADENASLDSLIPSPLPQTTALSRPRRRLQPPSSARDQDSRSKHRFTRSEAPVTTARHLPSPPPKPLARGTSPIRSIGLSTPPRSRNGSLTESPTSAQFSSPPRALTETYERIDQEEDLAATEGEISDPESELGQEDNAGRLDGYEPPGQTSTGLPLHKEKSPGLTPTGPRFSHRAAQAQSEDLTTASILSDPTGISFLNQLSDSNLAHAMTPHVLQSAADKEALRKIWDSKKPIAFGKARQIHLDADDPVESIESPPQHPPQRLIAFSKAGKRKLASDFARLPLHQRTFSDVTDRLEHDSQRNGPSVNNDNWHNDDLRREALPHNPRIHRVPYFARTHGFPERQHAPDSNADNRPIRQARSESPFATSSIHKQVEERTSQPVPSLHQTRLANMIRSEPDLTLDSRGMGQMSSDVKRAQAAATKAVQTADKEPLVRSESRISATTDVQVSPEKSRRFDLDFTGQSFQVSDSPPVRTKSLTLDSSREREIRGLEKRAVTTSRLSQLRARESSDALRERSVSPVLEEADIRANTSRSDTDLKANGQSVSDTPTFGDRSKAIGSGSKTSVISPVRPSPDRSQSYDLLQRLARSGSTTPRSSTPSNKPAHDNTRLQSQREIEVNTASTSNSQHEMNIVQGSTTPGVHDVNATPKVTGAWTDTILPDTVKTVKQNNDWPIYSQTPHVSAGGWIDTPAPVGQSSRLEPVAESTQEILAEITSGIVKGSSDMSDQTVTDAKPIKPAAPAPPHNAPNLTNKILSNSMNNADDSLVLGNNTLQSIQNYVDMDQTDVTILSHITEDIQQDLAGQTDTEVLGHLGTTLDRLRTHIHDAHKGLSKLESQISQPEQNVILPALPTNVKPCEVCGQPESPDLKHTHMLPSQTYLPFTVLSITLPIPILFRTRTTASNTKFRLPQLTPAGWVVFTIWTWYILECTLAEIYSHPTYASHYIWPTESEPEFPYVLPTMLWRWSRLRWLYPSLVQPIFHFVMGILRMIGMACGLIDGYVDGPQDAVVERLVETVYQSVENVGIAGMDMMNDEFL